MDNNKSNWSAMLKASSIGSGVFTEKMKQSVIYQVEQNQRKKGNSTFYYIAASLIGLMICISIFPFLNDWAEGYQSHKIGNTSGTGLTSDAISDEDIILNYEPTKELKYIPETDRGVRNTTLLRLPLTSVHIQEAVTIDGFGKYVDYHKPEDGSTWYFGFELANHFSSENGEFYEIGYGRMSDVNLQKSDAFGFSDLRLDGKCGPHRRCVYWISIDQDVVKVYDQMDASTIYEQDLDGDGITEAIVLTDAQDIYIYKNIDDQILSVRVQTAFNNIDGAKLTYNPNEQVFQLSSSNESKSYRYAARENKLEPLRD